MSVRSCSDCGEIESINDLEFEDYFDDGVEELLCNTCLNKRNGNQWTATEKK